MSKNVFGVMVICACLSACESPTSQSNPDVGQASSSDWYKISDGHFILQSDINSTINRSLILDAYSDQTSIFEITLKNGWLIQKDLKYGVSNQGQMGGYNSPDYNCIGFEQDFPFRGDNKDAKERILLCKALSPITIKSKTYTSNAPINIDIAKDEMFYEDEDNIGGLPLVLRITLKN